MEIVTWYDDLATRGLAWCAIDDRTYDGPDSGSPFGRGATEIEAVRDLLDKLEEKAQRASARNALTRRLLAAFGPPPVGKIAVR